MSILGLTLTLFITAYDPFNISTRSETAFQAAVQAFSPWLASSTSADRVALIVTTKSSYSDPRLDVPFPLNWSSQAALLSYAVDSGAKVVFLDYNYLRRTDRDASLALGGEPGADADPGAQGLAAVTVSDEEPEEGLILAYWAGMVREMASPEMLDPLSGRPFDAN